MIEEGRKTNTGLRIAVVGKGGVGKSLLAGTLARIFARRGHRVLALDVDTMPGLALSLGLALETAGDAGLPEALGERQEGRGWVLRDGEDVAALVQAHAAHAPDGVRFLQLGKLPGSVRPGSTTAFRAVLEDFGRSAAGAEWTLIGDLAAGTRQPFFGWADFARLVLLVVEPSGKSLLAARRLAKLAEPGPAATSRVGVPSRLGVVVNRTRSSADVNVVEQALPGHALPVLAAIPYDEQLAAAERQGQAPIDVAPDAPALAAIIALAERIERMSDR